MHIYFVSFVLHWTRIKNTFVSAPHRQHAYTTFNQKWNNISRTKPKANSIYIESTVIYFWLLNVIQKCAHYANHCIWKYISPNLDHDLIFKWSIFGGSRYSHFITVLRISHTVVHIHIAYREHVAIAASCFHIACITI